MPIAEAATVIGWLVSPIIKEIVGTVKSTATSKYRSLKDFSKQLDRLVHILEQLQDTVESVRAMSDNVSNRMISQLINAIYEVQDIFDMFDYRKIVLARMHKGRQIAHSTVNTVRRVIGRDKAFSRLKELMEELVTIQQRSRDLVQLKQLQASNSAQDSDPKSTVGLFPSQDKLFGYNEEYDHLLSALLKDPPARSSRGRRGAQVVAVIGHSGVGKTAIAQHVFSDEKVKGHFDLRIWVSVSHKFSETDLLTEICKSVPVNMYKAPFEAQGFHGHFAGTSQETVPSPQESEILPSIQNEPKFSRERMSFGVLQLELSKLVTSRRFLLVLDDVCNDESEQQRKRKWRDVLAPFNHGKQGSRILMTTQANICSKILNAGTRIMLKGIIPDDMVLLLKESAFKDEHKDVPHLEEVLRGAAEKLMGSPLAAKAFVDKVTRKHRREAWEEALEVYCSESGSIFTDKSFTDKLRYRHLPPHMQYCLAFCSIFPRNWKFEPEALVKMWLAHGIISDNDGRRNWKGLQRVARNYIRALQSRSFFQATKHGKTTYFVMHEQIHSMILSTSANHGFFRIDSNIGSIPPNVHHLSVTSGCLAQLKNDPQLRKLRTLLVFDSQSSPVTTMDNDMLKNLKVVRVLDLAGTSINELPEAIGRMKHMRYLGLPKTLKRLPAAVTKLLFLQTLAIGKECVLDEFPADCMNRLVNLRHLDVHTRYILEIGGIGRMKKLQGPVQFCAAMGQGHGMEELAGMDSLQETLSITGLQAVANRVEAQKAQLERKNFVKVIKFEWETTLEDASTSVHEQVLEGLKPHSKIQELYITRYQGTSSPSWLENSPWPNLSYLHLINCRNWNVLPALGQLPRLKVLLIKEMYSVDRIGPMFYGSNAFPTLEKLVLDDMPNLVEWTAGSTDNTFRRLGEVNIRNCPKLEMMPQLPSTVKKMKIEKGNSSYMNLTYSSKSRSYSLDICGDAIHLLREDLLHQDHITAISSLNIMQYTDSSGPNISHFTSVQSLSLRHCVLTNRLLSMYLQRLQSLERLQILDCCEFEAFPDDAVLSSLRSFEIKGCHPVLMESLRDKTGPAWTKICSIPQLQID